MTSSESRIGVQNWWSFLQLFRSVAPDENDQRVRIRFMERNTMLPVKAVYFILLVYYLYFSLLAFSSADLLRWLGELWKPSRSQLQRVSTGQQ